MGSLKETRKAPWHSLFFLIVCSRPSVSHYASAESQYNLAIISRLCHPSSNRSSYLSSIWTISVERASPPPGCFPKSTTKSSAATGPLFMWGSTRAHSIQHGTHLVYWAVSEVALSSLFKPCFLIPTLEPTVLVWILHEAGSTVGSDMQGIYWKNARRDYGKSRNVQEEAWSYTYERSWGGRQWRRWQKEHEPQSSFRTCSTWLNQSPQEKSPVWQEWPCTSPQLLSPWLGEALG